MGDVKVISVDAAQVASQSGDKRNEMKNYVQMTSSVNLRVAKLEETNLISPQI